MIPLVPELTASLVDRWYGREEQVAKAPAIDPNNPAQPPRPLLTYTEKHELLVQQFEELRPFRSDLDRIAPDDCSFCITDAAKPL